VPETAEPASLAAQIRSVTPRVAAPFVDPSSISELQGQIDASIALQSDAAALDRVQGTVTLDRAELSIAGVSFDQQRPTRLILSNGRLEIAEWEWGRDDNRLTLAGGLSLARDPALAIDLTTTLDLRLLNALGAAASASGQAHGQVRLRGTVNDPTLDGGITVANGDWRMVTPRLIATDVNGAMRLSRDSLTLESLRATVNGGDTRIDGAFRHQWFRPVDGAVMLDVRGAAVDVAGLRAEADANLSLRLTPSDLVASGIVTLLRGSYREPLSLTGGLLLALQGSSAVARPGESSAVSDVRLDVRIVTEDDLLVDNNYARLRMGADLRLVGTVGQPALSGRATLPEGGLVFFGSNRYRLEEQGSIEFTNPTRIEPDLNLRAVTRVRDAKGEHEITLGLKGTPATLQTTLTSDTNLSQAHIVSLLVTGRGAGEAGADGFTPGSEELLGYLSGELFGTVGRAVGLDTFRVERGMPDVRFDAGLIATETDPGARLTFGRTAGRDVQLVFSQSLRQHDGLTWIVSYAPRLPIELRTVWLDGGDRLYQFQHNLVFAAPAHAAPSERPPTPPRVSQVHIVGAAADEPALRERMKLSAGDRFSFFQWQDDRDRLEAYYHDRDYLEARVTTRRVPPGVRADSATGVELVYEVRPGPHAAIAVEGFQLERATLSDIETVWTRAVVDDLMLEEARALVLGELADRGFVGGSVAASFDRPSPTEKRLRLVIDSGAPAHDRRVVFAGNADMSTDRLEAVIQGPELARAVWIDPDRVREALTTFYRREGYRGASVRVGPIETAGDSATRTIEVVEGEPFRIREVRVEGARASSADELRAASGLSSGNQFSEDGITLARDLLVRHYRARGFNAASVTLRVEAVRDRPQVDVLVSVEEGPQQRLREVVTAGAERTRPALISRALKLEPGQPVNLEEWNRARRRLYETGAFRLVDIEREPVGKAETASDGSQEQPVRAKVTVEEWSPIRVRYGLELSDLAPTPAAEGALAPEPASEGGRSVSFGVTGDIGLRNLFGRAVSAGLVGRYTPDFRAGRAYLTWPSTFGMPLVSNFFLSSSRQRIAETDRNPVADITGVTFEQRFRPVGRVEVAYSYTFERNHTFQLTPVPGDPFPFDFVVHVARLSPRAIVDTRDDLIDASRGWFHSSDLEYSGPSLGSYVRFIKYVLLQRYYRKVGPLVFASSARLGLATAFDQTLLPSERFFAGGGNSVRGYADDVLSPSDFFGPSGGNALLVLNQELRFPIFKWVRGVAFFDAGRAFDTPGQIRLLDLAASAGFGWRVQTPVVLLRLDAGIPFDSTFGPRRPRWFFSVGQTF
jgi:outer membrane protein assembly factor BamA